MKDQVCQIDNEKNEGNIMPFNYGEKTIRTFVKENDIICVVAKDIYNVLGMTQKGSHFTIPLDDDESGTILFDTPGGKQELVYVTESGFYTILIRSNKPEAKPFRRWVTHEVLPQIRQTGCYAMERVSEVADNLQISDLIDNHSTVGDVGRVIDCLQYSFDRLERKVDFAIEHLTKALPVKKLKPVQLSWFERFVNKWWDKRVNRVTSIDDLYELLTFADQSALGILGTGPQSIKRQLRKVIRQHTGSPIGGFTIKPAGKRLNDYQLIQYNKK